MNESTLIELYAATCKNTRRRGRRWYPTMRSYLQELGRQHDRPLSQVAAVFAITSVDAQLASNIKWTIEILEGKREHGRYPVTQAPKIRAVLYSRYPGRYVTGPKVQAFYRALMGDPDALVLDRWMLWIGEKERKSVGARLRAQIEQTYRNAALTCGERPAHFQAALWIHLRETTPDSRGRLRRLPDITHNGFSGF